MVALWLKGHFSIRDNKLWCRGEWLKRAPEPGRAMRAINLFVYSQSCHLVLWRANHTPHSLKEQTVGKKRQFSSVFLQQTIMLPTWVKWQRALLSDGFWHQTSQIKRSLKFLIYYPITPLFIYKSICLKSACIRTACTIFCLYQKVSIPFYFALQFWETIHVRCLLS